MDLQRRQDESAAAARWLRQLLATIGTSWLRVATPEGASWGRQGGRHLVRRSALRARVGRRAGRPSRRCGARTAAGEFMAAPSAESELDWKLELNLTRAGARSGLSGGRQK